MTKIKNKVFIIIIALFMAVFGGYMGATAPAKADEVIEKPAQTITSEMVNNETGYTSNFNNYRFMMGDMLRENGGNAAKITENENSYTIEMNSEYSLLALNSFSGVFIPGYTYTLTLKGDIQANGDFLLVIRDQFAGQLDVVTTAIDNTQIKAIFVAPENISYILLFAQNGELNAEVNEIQLKGLSELQVLISMLETRIDKLNSEIEILENSNEDLTEELSQLQAELELLEAELTTLKAKNEVIELENEELKQENIELNEKFEKEDKNEKIKSWGLLISVIIGSVIIVLLTILTILKTLKAKINLFVKIAIILVTLAVVGFACYLDIGIFFPLLRLSL